MRIRNIAKQSVFTNWQASDLILEACEAAGLDPDIALVRPRHATPANIPDWKRAEHRRAYWRLIRDRCKLAYFIRCTVLDNGKIPSYPIVASCLKLRSHSQAMRMVAIGRVHALRDAWPRSTGNFAA